MNDDPIKTLYQCSEILDGVRFAGLNQNPGGIRDLLYSAIRDAERKMRQSTNIKLLKWQGDKGLSPVSDDLSYHVMFTRDGSMWGFGERGHGYYTERAVGFGRLVSGPHETIDQAKAAAQTDYEQRIRAALNSESDND